MKKTNLLLEGGAGMHMMHPFDLPSINTGKDLIDFFYKAAEFVTRNPEKVVPSDSTSLKVDGANTAFKLIRNSDGKFEFAFDRGSMKPVDIEGVTISRLTPDRWSPEHGMVEMGKIQLSALNKALDSSQEIKEILIDLGLLSEDGDLPISSKYVNTEFCWKETNAVKYNEDFIAFHGINQFYEKEWKGVRRPGLIRPLEKDLKTGQMKPIKAAATPVPYDEEAMERFREIVAPFFKEAIGPKNLEGFNVYTVIPVHIKEGVDLVSDVDAKLNESLSIQIRSPRLSEWKVDESSGTATMTIKEWLSDERTVNPRGHMITTADGEKKGAMSKDVYGRILNGQAIEDLLEDPGGWDTPMAINGALFYYSIENVGATILEALTSPLGDLITADQAHEGIVLRNIETFGVDSVKITGNFITAGQVGKFAQSPTTREEQPEQGEVNDGLHIALIPGAFKPPHKGHLYMVERFSNIDRIDKVLIIISRPLKESRTLPTGEKINEEHSRLIWENYLAGSDADIDKIEIVLSPDPSSVAVVVDYTREAYEEGNSLTAPTGARVYLGCGEKGDDIKRYDDIHARKRKDLKIQIVACPTEIKHGSDYLEKLEKNPDIKKIVPSVRDPKLDEKDFHAKDMRALASASLTSYTAFEMFSDFVPHGDALSILGMLGINPANAEEIVEPEEPQIEQEPPEEVMETVFNSIFSVIMEDTPFQAKMKKRLSKAHKWFLDQGRHDLVKYGGPFKVGRPQNKSNAFLAEETEIIDNAGQIWDKESPQEEDQEKIEELSGVAAGGGGIEGHTGAQDGPWGDSFERGDPKPKKKKKKKKQVKIRRK